MATTKMTTMEIMDAMEINLLKLGCKIINKEVQAGNQKKDKEGNLVFNPDGSPAFWSDSHYVELASTAGTIKIKVTSQIADSVEVDKRYQFIGRCAIKTPERGFPFMVIEPLRFDALAFDE